MLQGIKKRLEKAFFIRLNIKGSPDEKPNIDGTDDGTSLELGETTAGALLNEPEAFSTEWAA